MAASFLETGTVQVAALGTLAAAATASDLLIPITGGYRFAVFLQGAGPNPVGTISVVLMSKAGAASAVALAEGRLVRASLTTVGARHRRFTASRLAAGGVYTVAAADTVSPFQLGLSFDVPVLPDDATHLVVRVTNNGSVGTALTLVAVADQYRY